MPEEIKTNKYQFTWKTFLIDAVITIAVIAVIQGIAIGFKMVYDQMNERDRQYQELIWQLQGNDGKININWGDKDNNRHIQLGGTEQQ